MEKNLMVLKKQKGFTLVELLIVMAIIAILVATILMMGGGATDSATASQIISDLRSAKSAVAIVALTKDGKDCLMDAVAKDEGATITDMKWSEQGFVDQAAAVAFATSGGASSTIPASGFVQGTLLAKNLGGIENSSKYFYTFGEIDTKGTPADTTDDEVVLFMGKAATGYELLSAVKGMGDLLPNLFFLGATGDGEVSDTHRGVGGINDILGENGPDDIANLADNGFIILMRVH